LLGLICYWILGGQRNTDAASPGGEKKLRSI